MESTSNRFKRSLRNARILREAGFVFILLAGAGLAHAQGNPSAGANPDVVGIKVGISRVAEARAALAAVTPALAVREVETQLMGRSSAGYGIPVEGGKYLSELQAVTRSVKILPGRENNWSCPGGNCETLRVIFSGPPSGGVAVNVMRRMDIPSSGPSLDTLSRSLTEKYGAPSFHQTRGDRGQTHHFAWAWSSDGRPLPLNESHPCAQINVANGGTGDPSGQEHIRSFLKHGCAKAVFVMVSTNNQIVNRLWVDAIDHASIDKALTQTRAFTENYVRGIEQKERDKAAKTKGPKL
ncbi:MAG TPA: hypothetical protein DD658_12005 [Deltaproteobacteria bacterium]|nr:hypothetical protein [Deltaproteobacteria bacterium]